MFDIGWTELVVIACVAILVVGPKDLPRMLRTVGKTVGNLRRMASDFQGQFNDALKEAELHEMKEEANKAASKMKFSPLDDAKKSMEDFTKTVKEKQSELNEAVKDPVKAVKATVSPDTSEIPASDTKPDLSAQETVAPKTGTPKPVAKKTAARKTPARKASAEKPAAKPAASKSAAARAQATKPNGDTAKPAAKKASARTPAAAKKPATTKSASKARTAAKTADSGGSA